MDKTLKQEYMKQRRRIQRFLSSAKKRGYSFDYSLPSIPKKITEGSIRKLKEVTPKKLYEKATFTGTSETGEVVTVSGRQGRNIERSKSAAKAVATRKSRERTRKFTEKADSYWEEQQRDREARAKQWADDEYNDLLEDEERDFQAGEIDENEETDEYWRYREDDDLYETRKREGQQEIEELERLKAEIDAEISKKKEELGLPKDKAPHERFYEESDYEQDDEEADEEDSVLQELEDLLDKWTPSPIWTQTLKDLKTGDYQTTKDILNACINEIGRNQVARNAQSNPELVSLLEGILYDSGSKEGNFKDGRTQVNADIGTFKSLLLGRPLTPDESKDLSDTIEINHYFEIEK